MVAKHLVCPRLVPISRNSGNGSVAVRRRYPIRYNRPMVRYPSFVAWCILVGTASPVLLAGLATASQDATHFYIENDVLKIGVLRSTGSLDGIIHKQSGVNLQSNNTNNQQAI